VHLLVPDVLPTSPTHAAWVFGCFVVVTASGRGAGVGRCISVGSGRLQKADVLVWIRALLSPQGDAGLQYSTPTLTRQVSARGATGICSSPVPSCPPVAKWRLCPQTIP